MKLNKLSVLSIGLIASGMATNEAVASSEMMDASTDGGVVTPDVSAIAVCDHPANRDYNDVLAAYTGEDTGEYKFSGCGSAI